MASNEPAGDNGGQQSPLSGASLPNVVIDIAAVTLLVVLVILVVVAVQGGGADLGHIAPVLAITLLGVVVSPLHGGAGARLLGQREWGLLVALAAVAAIVTGLLTLFASSHQGASGAFAASLGALAGLFIDVSGLTVAGRMTK